jgi:hypothetical protein
MVLPGDCGLLIAIGLRKISHLRGKIQGKILGEFGVLGAQQRPIIYLAFAIHPLPGDRPAITVNYGHKLSGGYHGKVCMCRFLRNEATTFSRRWQTTYRKYFRFSYLDEKHLIDLILY